MFNTLPLLYLSVSARTYQHVSICLYPLRLSLSLLRLSAYLPTRFYLSLSLTTFSISSLSSLKTRKTIGSLSAFYYLACKIGPETMQIRKRLTKKCSSQNGVKIRIYIYQRWAEGL